MHRLDTREACVLSDLVIVEGIHRIDIQKRPLSCRTKEGLLCIDSMMWWLAGGLADQPEGCVRSPRSLPPCRFGDCPHFSPFAPKLPTSPHVTNIASVCDMMLATESLDSSVPHVGSLCSRGGTVPSTQATVTSHGRRTGIARE